MPAVPAPRAHRIPGVALVASVLVIAVVVNALVAGQQATVTPSTRTPLPVTLTAVPLTGTTVTGGVSASTVSIVPTALGASTLTVAREAPFDWDVRIAVTAASGITGSGLSAENLVLSFAGGPSLTLAPGTVYPQESAAASLTGTGLTVTTASTAPNSCHSCSVTAELRITPPSSSLPLFVYPYTITTAI